MEKRQDPNSPSKNAIKHGCCAAEMLILAIENIEDFKSLEKSMREAYDTPTEWEADMLNHAIETEWFHIRATKAYAEVEAKLYQDTPNPADWTEDQHKKLSRFLRYKTKHAHDVNAYLKQLEAFKRNRRSEMREQRANIVKHEKLESKQAKLESNQEKKQTEQDKSAKLAMLDALSQQGLVRWQDLEGVFD